MNGRSGLPTTASSSSSPIPVIDRETKAALKLIKEFRLDSDENILAKANKLPKYFSKVYFIHHCRNILQKPAVEAIAYYDFFFLNMSLATLNMLKLINQLGKNALNGFTQYTSTLDVATQFTRLEFSIREMEGGQQAFAKDVDLDNFYQGGIFSLIFNLDDLNQNVLLEFKNKTIAEIRQAAEGMARSYLAIHNEFRQVIVTINKSFPLQSHFEKEPTSLVYALTVLTQSDSIFNKEPVEEQLMAIEEGYDAEQQAQSFYDRVIGGLTKLEELTKAIRDKQEYQIEVINKLNSDYGDSLFNIDTLNTYFNGLIKGNNPDIRNSIVASLDTLTMLILSMQYTRAYQQHTLAYHEKLAALRDTFCSKNGSKKLASDVVIQLKPRKKTTKKTEQSESFDSSSHEESKEEQLVATPVLDQKTIDQAAYPALFSSVRKNLNESRDKLQEIKKLLDSIVVFIKFNKGKQTAAELYPDYVKPLAEFESTVEAISKSLNYNGYTEGAFVIATDAQQKLTTMLLTLQQLANDIEKTKQHFTVALEKLSIHKKADATHVSAANKSLENHQKYREYKI